MATDLKNKLAAKSQTTQGAALPANTIQAYLQKIKPELDRALPKHMSADRLARVALTTIRLNPLLLECSIESLFGALLQAAQLGLEPGPLGHAYLVPFRNNKTGRREAQFIIGYKGMIDLARRSDQVVSIAAHIVYENDRFEMEYGLSEKLVHVPTWQNRGKPILAYMLARLKDGAYAIDVMTLEEIEAVRKRSKSPDSGPWFTDWAEMARKTVVRRGAKYLPLAIEIQTAMAQDETVKVEVAPDMTGVIDVSATPVVDLTLGEPPAPLTPEAQPESRAAVDDAGTKPVTVGSLFHALVDAGYPSAEAEAVVRLIGRGKPTSAWDATTLAHFQRTVSPLVAALGQGISASELHALVMQLKEIKGTKWGTKDIQELVGAVESLTVPDLDDAPPATDNAEEVQ